MSNTKKLFESFQRNLNENSEFIRVFPEDSLEFKRLKDFCIKLNRSGLKHSYSVQNTYFDFGQDWKWTTIIASGKDGGYQALTPADQEKIITNTNINEVLEKIINKDRIVKESSIVKPEKHLHEDEDFNNIQLYMNTWGNYNINGADVESINGGWMSVDQAKEFLEAHKDEEPFINDTENCPISVDEYDNPWEIIEQLEKLEDINNKDAFLAIFEEHNDNFEEALNIYESGDYIFFPGVDNDEDLGKAYVDMVGFEGVSNKENYIDRNSVAEGIEEYLDSVDEEYSEETLDAMVDEDIQTAIADNDNGFFENHFDYEAFGRDLNFEGYYYADTGAINTY